MVHNATGSIRLAFAVDKKIGGDHVLCVPKTAYRAQNDTCPILSPPYGIRWGQVNLEMLGKRTGVAHLRRLGESLERASIWWQHHPWFLYTLALSGQQCFRGLDAIDRRLISEVDVLITLVSLIAVKAHQINRFFHWLIGKRDCQVFQTHEIVGLLTTIQYRRSNYGKTQMLLMNA